MKMEINQATLKALYQMNQMKILQTNSKTNLNLNFSGPILIKSKNPIKLA